jgi:hypothetical protein
MGLKKKTGTSSGQAPSTHTPIFAGEEIGSIVQPVAGLDAEALSLFLHVAKRNLPSTSGFLAAVQDIAATWANVAADLPTKTADDIKQEIEDIGKAAHGMRDKLSALAGGSQVFRDLETGSMYLFMRNNEVGSETTDRPVVPSLPTDARNLPQLLQRLYGDLQALRVCCDHTAQNINPAKSSPKWLEREVVTRVALAYKAAYGELPPLSDWFAKAFMGFVGQRMRLSIGKTVVTQAVKACRSSNLANDKR